ARAHHRVLAQREDATAHGAVLGSGPADDAGHPRHRCARRLVYGGPARGGLRQPRRENRHRVRRSHRGQREHEQHPRARSRVADGSSLLRRMSARSVAAILVAALLTLFAGRASAHVIGLSRGEYTPRGGEVVAEIAMRADDASLAVPGLDSDGDGKVAPDEILRARPALEAAFFDELEISA